jgi:hypothetical protein
LVLSGVIALAQAIMGEKFEVSDGAAA